MSCRLLKRNSWFAMLVRLVVVLVVARAWAQEQSFSTLSPSSNPNYPLMDMFSGASSYYPSTNTNTDNGVRKIFNDAITQSPSDTLSNFANIIGNIARIMFSLAVLMFLKFMGGTLLLLPLALMMFAKVGLKVFLVWPIIARFIKYFKHKRKRIHLHTGRSAKGCPNRMSCVIEKATESGWIGKLGTTATITLLDNMEQDAPLTKMLLKALAGDKVAQCMSLDCNSGIDIAYNNNTSSTSNT